MTFFDDFTKLRDVLKQNGCASMGTLYREPLKEVVVLYDTIYKIKKGLR